MRIGVFDSGKGGSYIAERLRELLPEHEFIVADDSRNVPYGTREQAEIVELTLRAIQPLIAHCPLIVIACNTITTAAIQQLREHHPATQFVGLEPMLKPAASSTRTDHIIMLATPATLRSQRYQDLKVSYAPHLTVDEPITGHWPRLIEDAMLEAVVFDEVVSSHARGADVVVLGCTHYLALVPRLRKKMPDVVILEPSEAIARRIVQLLAQPAASIYRYD
jgi:glutamate racemase